MRPVQDGGLGMKRVLEYMEIPFETWESVGQMRMEFDKEGEMKTAVIYRLEELIRQKDITVNEAAIRSGVPPSTLKNILYGQSKNVGVVTIKKLCDGLEITIPEFFGDPIFAELEPEL